MGEITVEVDPEDLSKEVRDELQEEADMDGDIAQDKADELYLDNIETRDPSTSKTTEYITKNLKNKFSNLRNTLSNSGRIGKIVEIKPKKYNIIKFKIKTGNRYRELKLREDSTELAQIMAYHNVDNLSNLENKKIVYKIGFRDRLEYMIPKNINPLTKYRYKLFGVNHDLFHKISDVFEKNDVKFLSTFSITAVLSLIFISPLYEMTSSLPYMILSLTPVSIFLVQLIIIMYLIIWFIISDLVIGENHFFH